MNANEQSYEVPLVELLERVPKDARFWAEEKHGSTHYPVGRLSHQAAVMLRQQQAEIEVLKQQLVTTSSEAKLNYNKGHEDGRNLAVVKELTNDEMRKVINEIVDGVTVSEMVTFLAISRAILRKAQEK